jgi:hypothetical protein
MSQYRSSILHIPVRRARYKKSYSFYDGEIQCVKAKHYKPYLSSATIVDILWPLSHTLSQPPNLEIFIELAMDISLTIAIWLSLAVTILGLGSIATQFGKIIDQIDPFHSSRDV